MKSQETAAYWIEHVIKFGGSHLKSNALDMPWFEFYMFELLIVFIAAIIAVISTGGCILKWIIGNY
jgi:glucuronosyltransferase